MRALTTTLLFGGRYPEATICANDFEQVRGRVFEMMKRIVEWRTSGFAALTLFRRSYGLAARSRVPDLAEHPSDPARREYCPNEMTLDSLVEQRSHAGKVNPIRRALGGTRRCGAWNSGHPPRRA
jgi:hypothetical protein